MTIAHSPLLRGSNGGDDTTSLKPTRRARSPARVAGTFGGTETRAFTVPAGAALFWSLLNTASLAPKPAPQPKKDGNQVPQLRAFGAPFVEGRLAIGCSGRQRRPEPMSSSSVARLAASRCVARFRALRGGTEARRLRLDRARSETCDVVLHEERVDDGHRHRAQQGRGHELAPVEDVAPDQLGDGPHRHRADLALGQEDQRVEERSEERRVGKA